MRILSMTATFGKLEHASLTLDPGLNIIEAPNEWGKSTWCAFLVNMLYGIETRSRSTGTSLADKDRYAPWSGAAMSGRIDLEWNGKRITIERRTKGRTVFGDFNAYETDTGIEVTELNATNCGQVLLGVERNVFVRAGFLRAGDMPVTADDALRRRLNNLVTTGDESGAGDKLGQTLKDLKNKCRFNNSGLLPQAENEREQLRRQLQDLHDLQNQTERIGQRQQQLDRQIEELKNHELALEYAQSLDNIRQVEAAQAALEKANEQVSALEAQVKELPPAEKLEADLNGLEQLLSRRNALFMQPVPDMPQAPEALGDPNLLVKTAQEDESAYRALQEQLNKKASFVDILLGILTLGILPLLRSRKKKQLARALSALEAKHPGIAPENWVSHAQTHALRQQEYDRQLAEHQTVMADIARQKAELDEQLAAIAGTLTPEQCRKAWAQALDMHRQLTSARQALVRNEEHTAALKAMMRTVQAPNAPDSLTLTGQQTQQQLAQARYEQQQLQLKLGQCMGQAESLGQESLLKARLDTLNRRIARLEDTYYALELAQDALYQATTSLQRRFAPRISQQAQELFGKLTDGRYQRVVMAEDLSLSTSAQDEDTLHSAQWRSDGTADQLYLALRLAVARELTPHAPLVLDDAFVRFDDRRLKNAMEILKEEAKSKQVILFTCQGREKGV